jgi:DNA repair exonuclease SbcCD ATPase subunit
MSQPHAAAGAPPTAEESRFAPLRLSRMWERFGRALKVLWEDGSPAAVELQALFEEFRGESERAERVIAACEKTLNEQEAAIRCEFDSRYLSRIRQLEADLSLVAQQSAQAQKGLSEERARSEDLRRRLLNKEAETAALRDQFIKSEEERDHDRARKNAELHEALLKRREEIEKVLSEKERNLEANYAAELAALQNKQTGLIEEFRRRLSEIESQYVKREDDLSKAHERRMAELSSWETRNRERDRTLLDREGELLKREQAFEEFSRKKAHELERLKADMQAELARVVKRYQGGGRAESNF